MSGYSMLARMIGKHFGELSNFRTFSGLQAQSLLYMQAEMQMLEAEIKSFMSLREMQPFDQCFVDVSNKEDPVDAASLKRKFAELHEKLKIYHSALLQAAVVNNLPKPQSSDIGFLRQWLVHPYGGNSFLNSIEAGPWREQNSGDLVQLSGGRQPGDGFAESISDTIIPVYHKLIGRRLHKRMQDEDFVGVWEYKRESLDLLGNMLCMVLSAFVPTLSMFVLYFLRSIVARLATIIVFSLLFSILMTFVVEGRRSDVWAAKTAFAALQAVFIGVGNT